MRLSTLRILRLAGFMVLVLALAACAGEKKSSTPSSVSADVSAPAGQPAAAQVQPTDAGPTPEPLAATVNGDPITLAAFERERARRSVGMDLQPATEGAFDASVLQSLIDQVLIEQFAGREGIAVTDAEVDAELATQAQIATDSGLSFDEFMTQQMYTPDEYRQAQRGMLLWYKVSQVVTADVSPTAEMVHSRHILVADEALARDLIAQLNQGADFAQLAIQYSLDSSTAPSGGDLDWVTRGDLLQPEVENAIFALQPGELAQEPVRSSLGYHVIQVLEKAEGRPLDQASLAEKKEQAFTAWLQSQRDTATIERFVGTTG